MVVYCSACFCWIMQGCEAPVTAYQHSKSYNVAEHLVNRGHLGLTDNGRLTEDGTEGVQEFGRRI